MNMLQMFNTTFGLNSDRHVDQLNGMIVTESESDNPDAELRMFLIRIF